LSAECSENPFSAIGCPNRNAIAMLQTLRNEGARNRFNFVDDLNKRPTSITVN
jgi:hypothetical protein